jgi:hypothetical protein
MVTLTSWLDGLMAEASRRTGIAREQLSAHIGCELIATVLEVISDLFSKGWLKVAVNALAGCIALGYGVYGRDVPERLRREMIQIGSHLAFRALELVRFQEFWSSLQATAEAIKRGDVNAALASVLKTPTEVMAATVGLVPAPTTVTAPAYVVTPPPAPPTPQPAPAGELPPKAF